MKTECLVCEAPTNNVWLCNPHRQQLRDMLQRLPLLARELETTRAKQDHMAKTVGGAAKSGAAPAIVNFDAAEVLAELRRLLLYWTHEVYRMYGMQLESFVIFHMAHYIEAHLNQMVSVQPVGAMYTEVADMTRRIIRCIDLPPTTEGLKYAGVCGMVFDNGTCPHQLWARPGETLITCQRCGTDWDLDDRRAGALAAARNMVATADTISRALTAQDIHVTPHMIHVWKNRGRLTPTGTNPGNQWLYRVGDVMQLVKERKP